MLEAALERGVIVDAAIAVSGEQRRRFWHLRESVAQAQLRNGAVIYTDVSVAVSSVPAFIIETSERLRRLDPGVDINAFGHVGDGNVHFNLLQPRSRSEQEFLAGKEDLVSVIFSAVHAYGGSISAEHGIGQARVGALMAHKSSVELELMRRIRETLAQNVFNPGKVIPLP